MLRYFIFIEYGLLPDLRVGVLISASQRQGERDVERDFGAAGQGDHRQPEPVRKSRRADLSRPQLSEIRKGVDDPGRNCCHGRRQVYFAASGRASVFQR